MADLETYKGYELPLPNGQQGSSTGDDWADYLMDSVKRKIDDTSILVINENFNVYSSTVSGYEDYDNRSAINAAIQYAHQHNIPEVHLPSGYYKISVNDPADTSLEVDDLGGIYINVPITFTMHRDTTVKALPSSERGYAMFSVVSSNVHIRGGQVIGERYEHIGSAGAHGQGVKVDGEVENPVENVSVTDVIFKELWGDGIRSRPLTENINVTNCYFEDNRRMGVTVGATVGFSIDNCYFKNQNGINPQAGIDIEPNLTEGFAEDITITNSTFDDNVGEGIIAGGGGHGFKHLKIYNNKFINTNQEGAILIANVPTTCEDVTIDGNVIYFKDDLLGHSGIGTGNFEHLLITNNKVYGVSDLSGENTGGISVGNTANGIIVKNNTIKNVHIGISLSGGDSENCIITHNRIYNTNRGIFVVTKTERLLFSENIIDGVLQYNYFRCDNSDLINNLFLNHYQTVIQGTCNFTKIANNRFDNCGYKAKTSNAILDFAPNGCIIDNNHFQSNEPLQKAIKESTVPTNKNIYKQNIAMYGTNANVYLFEVGAILRDNLSSDSV